MLKSFPKIFALGQEYIQNIFDDEVEVSEKIDGSQLVFGKIDGQLYFRSKGAQIFPETCQKMFRKGVNYILSIQDKIADNTVYYCELLDNPNHNILKYDRTPKNNLILFGVSDEKGNFEKTYGILERFAEIIDIDVVPLLYEGKIEKSEELNELLNKDSILGGTKIEGIVVKNYFKPFLLGGQLIPIMMGKFVSELFKETHREKWGQEFTTKGRWKTFLESFKTEARWYKAIQHLKEKDELENSPRDIGKLMKEINLDIEEEEKESIKEFLWKEFGKEALRYSTKGFPEFYKTYLMEKSFD